MDNKPVDCMEDLLKMVLSIGVPVEVELKDHCLVYKVCTGAKSSIVLHAFVDEGLYYTLRYGEYGFINDWYDFLVTFASCYRMRGFGDIKLIDECVKHGILNKRVREEVSYD